MPRPEYRPENGPILEARAHFGSFLRCRRYRHRSSRFRSRRFLRFHAPPVAAIAIPLVRKESGFQEVKADAPALAPKPVVRASGFQSTESSVTGPARGTVGRSPGSFNTASNITSGAERAPVRNARFREQGGFSDASASSARAASHGSITSGTFGDTTVDKECEGQTALPRASGAALTPVEILSKPKPAYTEEARAKKIEGEVLLEGDAVQCFG